MKRLQMRVRHGRREQHIHLPPSEAAAPTPGYEANDSEATACA